MAFIDLTKAYDTVNREILWRHLSLLGFGGKFLRTLQAMYTGDSVTADVNGVSSKPVYLRRGLRQGCSLSPLLFNLYIAVIADDLAALCVGYPLGNSTVSGLLFADDIVLVADSEARLKTLVALLNQCCSELCLSISVEIGV